DGGVTTHTIRLELADEPGELLHALQPIADNGGNLLSIFHERGHLTPRGRIPVEVDLSCPPDRFDAILSDLREAGVNVVQADERRYADEVTVLLVGDGLEAALSPTLGRVNDHPAAQVADVTLESAADGPASARLRLRAREGRTDAALAALGEAAADHALRVIEPLGVEP
ncbi:MAG: amino acid-binding protein, partial [Halobaculum sp.]